VPNHRYLTSWQDSWVNPLFLTSLKDKDNKHVLQIGCTQYGYIFCDDPPTKRTVMYLALLDVFLFAYTGLHI
jgi:hypothetical protein